MTKNAMNATPPATNTSWSEQTWSAQRARHKADEKRLMASYFVHHDFLVREGYNPESDLRETVASVLVNQGTTPNVVVEEAVRWIEENQERGPFDITWYTPGHLIPSTLRAFRLENPHLAGATQLFLFPGKVDQQTEAVSGPDAEGFAERLSRRFTYALLSAYSFDLHTGTTYFHMPGEVRLQRACATRYAAYKFLFLDSSKFKSEGEIGYNIHDLLEGSNGITIYTVSSTNDEWIKSKFELLCDKTLNYSDSIARDLEGFEEKFLRLRIIGTVNKPTISFEKKGLQKTHVTHDLS